MWKCSRCGASNWWEDAECQFCGQWAYLNPHTVRRKGNTVHIISEPVDEDDEDEEN